MFPMIEGGEFFWGLLAGTILNMHGFFFPNFVFGCIVGDYGPGSFLRALFRQNLVHN
jgi:putative heme iron utilization protein